MAETKDVTDLTDDEVREIRRMAMAYPALTHRAIGAQFGLTRAQTSAIIRRRVRKDVR